MASLGAARLYGFWEGGGMELITQAYYSCQGSNPGEIAMQLSLHAAFQPPPVQDFLSDIYCTARTVAGYGVKAAIGLALQFWASRLGPREHNI